MEIAVLNLAECIAKVRRIADIDITRPITDGTLMVQRVAKDLAPVKTGRLRNSIHIDIEGKGYDVVGRVYNNVEYAPYQEFGTTRMVAQPFLRPALVINRDKIKERLMTHIKKELNKLKG
jgi:HK97 gp10 family phage protein